MSHVGFPSAVADAPLRINTAVLRRAALPLFH